MEKRHESDMTDHIDLICTKCGRIENLNAKLSEKITLPAVLGINHWIVILVAVFVGLFYWFEKKGL